MRVGSLYERASWPLVIFVFGCIFIIIGLLFSMVRAEQKADYLDSVSFYSYHNPEVKLPF